LKTREKRILFYILNCHLILKQYGLVLQILEKLNEKFKDTKLKSLMGLIYLETGMMKKAKSIFDEIEKEVEDPEKNLQCRLNRAYINYGNGLYSRAIEDFNFVLSIDPKNIQAANNCAICYLNCRNLESAMGLLEDLIIADPNETLNEIAVSNLKMLYNLGSPYVLF
jgi:tetratricopeptide (TPR) repeat protein